LADFVRVASTSEIPQGKMKKVMYGTQQVLLANVGGTFHAIGNVCTHVGGPLDRGVLEGHEVQCPLHASRFDVTSGSVTRGPAARPEPRYEVIVEGQDVKLRPRQ
jgi:nitrite reductase/ring-hydroxylating ferredoxin subunit